MGGPLLSEEERELRFNSVVDRSGGPDACWPYLLYRNRKGYGVVGVRIPKVGTMLAHRYAWSLEHGPISDDVLICHHCDNPPCCNNRHLFRGDQMANSVDKVKKGRQHHPRGVRNGRAKITDREAEEIRAQCALGRRQKDIADDFGISQTAVSFIKLGKTWASRPETVTA